jgi:hypothetical protein
MPPRRQARLRLTELMKLDMRRRQQKLMDDMQDGNGQDDKRDYSDENPDHLQQGYPCHQHRLLGCVWISYEPIHHR